MKSFTKYTVVVDGTPWMSTYDPREAEEWAASARNLGHAVTIEESE